MNHLDLFSGIGGFALAARMAGGIDTIGFVEIDPYCRLVLKKNFPGVPIFEDIKELTWDVQKNRKKPISKTSRWLTLKTDLQAKQKELILDAQHAELFTEYRQAEQDKSTVVLNADIDICKEKTGRIQEEEIGCGEIPIRTGKTELDMKEGKDTICRKSINGDDVSSPEIGTHVRIADLNRESQGNSTHTTLKDGLNTHFLDLKSVMESRYASYATQKDTAGIDLITAGFPCQPASVAGKRQGTDDYRWIWDEIIRIVHEVNPTWILLENVCGLISLSNGMVFENCLLDMEDAGYEVQPLVIPACAVDAKHRRDRVWIVAHTQVMQRNGEHDYRETGRRQVSQLREGGGKEQDEAIREMDFPRPERCSGSEWPVEPNVDRVASRVPKRVDRLKSLGNAIVPQVAAEILKAIIQADQTFSKKDVAPIAMKV